ncbi:hypothetical protein ACH4Y0_00015 [Streptomyces sp. NPDC020707]|uniref:hypothetical protein n=1 Tax=Streptomyces sp. NPDC020707 TaxID=3365084 RepID=UPI0037B9E45E
MTVVMVGECPLISSALLAAVGGGHVGERRLEWLVVLQDGLREDLRGAVAVAALHGGPKFGGLVGDEAHEEVLRW